MLLVIDSSGSMAGAGRFDAAIAEARALAGDASDARLISVIDAGPRVKTEFVPALAAPESRSMPNTENR